jgi:hypothetical protein
MRTFRGRAAAIAIATSVCMAGATLAAFAAAPKARPARAASAHPAQVVGAVVDREGTAVGGVTVVARPVGLITLGVTSRVFETVTDSAGHFTFNGLPPGTYWFVAFEVASSGSSPAVPVIDHLELRLRLDDELVRS